MPATLIGSAPSAALRMTKGAATSAPPPTRRPRRFVLIPVLPTATLVRPAPDDARPVPFPATWPRDAASGRRAPPWNMSFEKVLIHSSIFSGGQSNVVHHSTKLAVPVRHRRDPQRGVVVQHVERRLLEIVGVVAAPRREWLSSRSRRCAPSLRWKLRTAPTWSPALPSSISLSLTAAGRQVGRPLKSRTAAQTSVGRQVEHGAGVSLGHAASL